MKKMLIVILILFVSITFAQQMRLPQVKSTDYWIDYDNLKNITLGMERKQVEVFIGEPRKILSLNIVESDTIFVVEYSVKIKNTVQLPLSKPRYFLQTKPTTMWGEEYSLKFTYNNYKLNSIQ